MDSKLGQALMVSLLVLSWLFIVSVVIRLLDSL